MNRIFANWKEHPDFLMRRLRRELEIYCGQLVCNKDDALLRIVRLTPVSYPR
jgi:hypothetical protein